MKGWLVVLLSLLSASCSGGAPGKCEPVDAGACPEKPPSFANEVLPVLNRDCNATCHAPNMGQWPLIEIDDVQDWSSLIRLDVEDCAMPPADAGALTTEDQTTILDWIACGSPNN